MTTDEKIAALRKKVGITQEQMADILGISRQSVSRWEIDMAFPETEKLIKLSKLLNCSIDYLLNTGAEKKEKDDFCPSIYQVYEFFQECGYFFLATSNESIPSQRPMGMMYSDEKFLYIATDRRKNLFSEVKNNANVSIASYNLRTRRWARINGTAEEEVSITIYREMIDRFPILKQKCADEEEMYFVILRISVKEIEMS